METISAVKTMKTITGSKQEFITIINGLFSVQELKGKEFSLVVSKNIEILRNSLKDLEEAGKPSEEFMKLAEQVNAIAEANEEGAKEAIQQIEKDNQELVDARRDQMDKLTESMKEEITIDLNIISEDLLPEDITAKQINMIIKITE
jgi:hypothetical protein|tara:strand:- start:206 stop:646 length:441 start_codon:yes stop_codon:yes gene_type:complete